MKTRPALVSFVVHTAAVFALIHLGAVYEAPRQLTLIPLASTKIVYHPERQVPGGGGRQVAPPSRGEPPKAALFPLVPPTTRVSDHTPELPAPPAIAGQEAVNPLPQGLIGDPHGVAGPPSDGPGRGPGIGRGRGPYGVGDGGDGRTPRPETSVTTPAVLLYKIEPEFTDEARKARVQGMVTLWAEIGEDGRPANIQVRHGLGLGLDERAVEAVSKWRFRPAMRNGKPVRAPALIEVTFRLL